VRAVFLDRDGVINQVVLRNGRPHPPRNLAELRINPDAEAGLPELKRLGFLLLVVSNQPDVARGTQTRAAVEEINAYLGARLPIDEFYVCYHDDADACGCRKPAPGMLLEAARKYGVSLRDSFLIGDRWRDIEAGNRVKCKTILVDYGYGESPGAASADFVAPTLDAAVKWIIANA